ncbi:hypothetical protein ABK040_005382 [Willaertia magna]
MLPQFLINYVHSLSSTLQQLPLPFLFLTLCTNAIVYIIELYLDYRQSKLLKHAKIPERLVDYIDEEEFEDMKNYSILRLSFSRLENTYGFILELFILLSGVLTWLYDYSKKVNFYLFNISGDDYIITYGVTFLFFVSILSTVMRAPFEVYRLLVIDGKFFETKQERKLQQEEEDKNNNSDNNHHLIGNECNTIALENILKRERQSVLARIATMNSEVEDCDNYKQMLLGDEKEELETTNEIQLENHSSEKVNNDETHIPDEHSCDTISISTGTATEENENFGTIVVNWLLDQIKMGFIAVVVGLPLLYLILYLLSIGSPIHWLYVWVGSVALAVGIYELYPILLAPMFNTFYELPEGSLRRSIENLAKQVGIKVSDIVYVDGSKRSEHANAFMIGSNENKKIVLYDNLLSKNGLNLTNDEILAILAHEINHYKQNHSIKVIMIQMITMGIFLFILSFMIYNEHFYSSFGFTFVDPSVGLCLFSYLYQPFSNAAMVISNHIQRSYEYQCDEYSQSLGYDMEEPLIRMHVNNVYNLIVDKHYSRYYNAHPSLLERLENIKNYKEKVKERKRLEKKLKEN